MPLSTRAQIRGVEYVLPHKTLSNEEIAGAFPDWPAEKIKAKTGIIRRHIAADDECASDLAVAAGRKMLATGLIRAEEVDFVILCTQSPDYFLPTTACLVQHRLGLPKQCGALDFNLGCSGFVYGLGLAKGLIETEQARNVLLLTAETYSKHIHPEDKSVRTLFGDAAAATLVSASEGESEMIGPFIYGTDGSGAANLIVPNGGMRKPRDSKAPTMADGSGNCRTENNLYMNGTEVFNFTLKTIPSVVNELLLKASLGLDQVDMWVFHQANGYMLEYLRKKLGIRKDRFALQFAEYGNTVSSTIPIALCDLKGQSQLRTGQVIGLVGFGVGYSWGATVLRWRS